MTGRDLLAIAVLALILTVDLAIEWFRRRGPTRRDAADERHEHAALMREIRRQP